MLEEEKHERANKDESSDRSPEVVVQSLRCDCASSSSKLVVYTCPACVAPVLRALRGLVKGG